MSKSFKDLNGDRQQLIDGITTVETDNDIISNKTVGYFVCVGDYKFEVSEEVYTAVKEEVE